MKALSKIIEKSVALKLNNYLMNNNLHENFHSAYKVHHSTETVMVRVQDDTLHAIDGNKAVVLLILVLSAAFDTVSHEILLDIGCLNVMVLQDLYKNGSHPTRHLEHNLFKLKVQDLLSVNLIVVYRRGPSLGLCYMFCTLHQWLIS